MEEEREYSMVYCNWYGGKSLTTTLTQNMLPAPNLVAKIEFKIRELRPLLNEFVIVELLEKEQKVPIGTIKFFQIMRSRELGRTNIYFIEVGVQGENGNIVYCVEGNREQAVQLFHEICVKRQQPNLQEWSLYDSFPRTQTEEEPKDTQKHNERERYTKLHSVLYLDDTMDEELRDFLILEIAPKVAFAEKEDIDIALLVDEYLDNNKYKEIYDLSEKYTYNAIVAFVRGEIEYFGYLGKQNLQEAYKYYCHAAKIGSVEAYIRLATLYKYGLGVAKNGMKYLDIVKKLLEIATYFQNYELFITEKVHLLLTKVFIEAEKGRESAISWCDDGIQGCHLGLLYCGAVNEDIVTKLLQCKYQLSAFEREKANLIDLFYIANKECTITLDTENTKIELKVKFWRQYRYVLCQGKKYESIARFLCDSRLHGKKLIEYNDKVKNIEVQYGC